MFDEKQAGAAMQEQASQTTLQAMAREVTEARGMVEAAKAFPRDEMRAFLLLDRACKRLGFADLASYSFPRGGETITGPSVNLAREAARCWGNITYGIRIVEATEETVHLQGWAWDMETNARVTVEDKFRKLIQRKVGKGSARKTVWIAPDERDLRELVNRRGALAERNAILKVLPKDLIEDAQDTAEETLLDDSEGRLGKNREGTVKSLVKAFDEFSVSPSMLEQRLGHSLGEISPEELADLRQVYRSLKDGNTRRGDHFDVADPRMAAEKADELTELVKGRGAPNPTERAPADEAEAAADEYEEELRAGRGEESA